MTKNQSFPRVSVFSLFEFWSPEGKVVSDQLHDGSGIFVLILFDLVNISNGIIEGLLGKLTGLAWVVFNFIVENWVVQSQT